MTAETYRRRAAECITMSIRREDTREKAMLVQMATMWIKLAELADKTRSTDKPPSDAHGP
jgi:hypothetical protein